jgi:hypothetical protein
MKTPLVTVNLKRPARAIAKKPIPKAKIIAPKRFILTLNETALSSTVVNPRLSLIIKIERRTRTGARKKNPSLVFSSDMTSTLF